MRRVYKKYFLHSLRQEKSRIFSIIAIVGLGIGFLVGLLSSTPDLYQSVDTYLHQLNTQDIYIKSNLGFSEEVADELRAQIPDVSAASMKAELEETGYFNSRSETALLIYQRMDSDAVNQVSLVSGRMPEAPNECLSLSGNPYLSAHAVGDVVSFAFGEYEIVGLVHDPLYLTKQEVISSASNQKIRSIFYLDSALENDAPDTYTITDLCFRFGDLSDENVFEEAYREKVAEKAEEIEALIEQNQYEEKNGRSILQKAIETEIRKKFQEQGISSSQIDALMETEMIRLQVEKAVDEQYEVLTETVTPQFYVLTHEEMADLKGFDSNAEKVALIATVFPVFFFAIALLVSLSSFSRIVSKDRALIGTFKALGYSSAQIYRKYVWIGFGACLIGCVSGVAIGIFLLPFIIYTVYTSLYLLPAIQFTFQFGYIFGISALMTLSVLAVAVCSVRKYLKLNTAELLHDRTMKPGKKILLERIPFLWKRFSFKIKSMFRNIFRFKKNLIMMLLGVGGCSAILIAGFGIDNSIGSLTQKQFSDIQQYNLIIQTSELQLEGLDAQMPVVFYEGGSVNGDKEYGVNLLGGSGELTDMIRFLDLSGNPMEFQADSCFVSRQIAEELDLKGGTGFVYAYNRSEYAFTVSGIVENYIGNWVYIGEGIVGKAESLEYNAVLAYQDFTGIDAEAFLDRLHQYDGVQQILYSAQTMAMYSSLTENLKGIVAILIIVSGLLAITVIYNLVDINMNERIKEIATLRVVGYQKPEVVMYIFREIFVMSLLGFCIGVGFGVLLHRFIMSFISSPGLIFPMVIAPLSYVYTGLLTLLFSLIVVIIFSPKILRINMTEALKSVE